MATETASLERAEPGAPRRALRWLRERVSRGETTLDRAVEEVVRENPDLVCPYPRPVADAVITRLDRSFRLGNGESLDEEQVVGFRCEERPTMIVVGNPMTPGFTEYRLEVQGDQCLEMELSVAGTGRERRLLRAVTWVESHEPGERDAMISESSGLGPAELIRLATDLVAGEKRDMKLAELIKLAADLEGRIQDDTFRSVERVSRERR